MARLTTSRTLRCAVTALASGALLVGCASVNPFANADPRWADYKNWQTAEESPSTGAAPGLGAVHKGPEGARMVYVNPIGAATLMGDGPYEFPQGTVLVKEQYDNLAAYDAGDEPDVTVSLKIATGPVAGENWHWAESYKEAAGDNAFCSGCHSIPIAKDFVFSTPAYLAANR